MGSSLGIHRNLPHEASRQELVNSARILYIQGCALSTSLHTEIGEERSGKGRKEWRASRGDEKDGSSDGEKTK